jgi:bifunctional DNA-binding transcriptional regulator/antitoxin component of YhaV-PrlF toxin-antitoxin module
MTAHYLKIKDALKLIIRDDYSEVWVSKAEGYKFEDRYEIIEELDYFKNEFKKIAIIEETRKKNMKMASMKAAALKL